MTTGNKIVSNTRILVANRGEIAIRIFRAATELNMTTIAIYSYEDRFSVHRFKADEAYQIGLEGSPLQAYLDWRGIINFAINNKIDAIHPGYGFLSENPDFAEACEKNGIMFCGPNSKTLHLFGNKTKAKQVAKDAGLHPIPGSIDHVATVDDALNIAVKFGYPVTLKAVSGGGGKGIRIVANEHNLRIEFERAQSEALTSFGQSEIYIEKTIVDPKHIEVQIMGDSEGKIVHLFERDCSIQRRHQKVVEIAPAFGIQEQTRSRLLNDAINLARHVGYIGVGTIEFLVDQSENVYFLEVNPRLQVEHTVTEMITGIDIVQSSIMLAAGRSLTHPAIGIQDQNDIQKRGVAIQCRITTEDPQNNFSPDTGKILAYRPAQGFGIRLDEGLGTSGGLVTPHYDSLLVKVTAHSLDLYGATRKMKRALSEFRIRGVKHNIPLLSKIISHPLLVEGSFTTNFLTKNTEVMTFEQPRDRATKLLRFIADVTINNPHNLEDKTIRGEVITEPPKQLNLKRKDSQTAKELLDKHGNKFLQEWILNHEKLLLTDTTMRDAQQSLFATRLRTYDILKPSQFYNDHVSGLFSLEVWGGATFDTSLRFLKEDPWERLQRLRNKIPKILFQMLLRGDNAVGYSNYPKWVIQDFIKLAAKNGVDVFRIFDCLNNPSQMSIALEEVLIHGKVAEASICYTGNILDPNKSKYDIKYYLNIANKLTEMGANILAIKDMAGLLRPKAAKVLVKALKEECPLPIHLHTHATAGNSIATLLAAQEAGCDIVDGAISSMSGLTSQPSLNALVACLEGTERSPEVALEALDELGPYWESVRSQYQVFDPGIKASSTRVYEHEIPGGQYSNLYDQARKVGLPSKEFYELTKRYKEVNEIFGDIIKVTPSSKVVGDLALLLQKNSLTGPELLRKRPNLDFPDSTISFLSGAMGTPYGGFPQEIRTLVLGKNPPEPSPIAVSQRDTFENTKQDLDTFQKHSTNEDVLSFRLYTKVYREYVAHKREFGSVDKLPTPVFLYGLQPNRELSVEIEPGKTLIINLNGYSEPDDSGMRTIFFQLNGFPREVRILDKSALTKKPPRVKADMADPSQIPAPMPGKVVDIKVKKGSTVKVGQILMVTESMKMEYGISAKTQGIIDEIHAVLGDQVDEGDLLCNLSIQ